MPLQMPRHPDAFSNDRAQNRRPRQKEEGFLVFIRGLPCLITGLQAEAAHIRMASPIHGKPSTGAGIRPDDRWCVPLSPNSHRLLNTSQHAHGEREWWKTNNIDPCSIAALLYSHYHASDPHAAAIVCRNARRFPVHRGVAMPIPKPRDIKLSPNHIEVLRTTEVGGKKFVIPRGAAIVRADPEIVKAAQDLIEARYLVLLDEGVAVDVAAKFSLPADTVWAIYLMTPRAAAALKAATEPGS